MPKSKIAREVDEILSSGGGASEYPHDRARRIVRLAAKQVKNPSMKMTAVAARLAELESRQFVPGLSRAEQNELRDCEITLGMVEAPPHARVEAARRVERFAAERLAALAP